MSNFKAGRESASFQNQVESTPSLSVLEPLSNLVSKSSRYKLELEGWEKYGRTKYFTPEDAEVAEHAYQQPWIDREMAISRAQVKRLQDEGYKVVLVPLKPEEKEIYAYDIDVYIRKIEPLSQTTDEELLPPTARETFLNRYLPEKDKELIKTGLLRLRELLESCPDEEVPQIILLPETAMRPLAYAIKPVIEQWYTSKGKKVPEFIFVKTKPWGHVIEAEQSAEEQYGSNYREKYLAGLYPELYSDYNIGEQIDKSRVALEARIAEISEKSGFKNLPPSLVIDDYARAHRATYLEIRRAYQRVAQTPNVPIRGFAFLTGSSPESLYYDDAEREQAQAKDNAINFKYGAVDPGVTIDGPRGPVWETDGFAFRSMGFYGMEAEKKQLMTGVTKETDGPYVSRSPEQSKAVMLLLRQEMRKIGETVVNNLTVH